MTNGTSPAGWYIDPTGQGDSRYWNGVAWTQSVNRSGSTFDAAIDATQAQTPPAPGTQVGAPVPPVAPPPQTVNVSNNHSVVGVILGVIAIAIAIAVLVVVINSDDSSDDTPTPGTEAPAEQPEPEEPAAPPASDGG